MVAILGGEFWLGDLLDSANLLALPVHHVIVRSFEISQYEISIGDFEAFVKDSEYLTQAESENWAYSYQYVDDTIRKWKREDINWKNPGFKQGDNHPVTCVSWNDAKAYCDWLSLKTGDNYRLPLEIEWEFISKNRGRSTKYPWGNSSPNGKTANFADFNSQVTWADKSVDDGYQFTAPVGSYLPNKYRIYDLAGNVWEWCEDVIKTYNGLPVKNYASARVMRGGSFHNKENTLRTTWRNYDYPDNRYYNLGFRVVRSR